MCGLARRFVRCAFLAVPVVLLLAALLEAGQLQSPPASRTGSLRGRVLDGVLGTGIAGVTIFVDGKASTTTDSTGAYRLRGLAAGTRILTLGSFGFDEHRFELVVEAGDDIRQDISLMPDLMRLGDIVVAPMQESRMRALSYQQSATTVSAAISADQVGRLPDTIVADALQRIPGATLQRDHGQGRYVGLRGLSASDTSIRVNGDVLMSPEHDSRAVALDTIPANLIQAIEINLTALPSADADGIGGSINLVTVNVPQRFRALGSLAGGYNSSRDSARQGEAYGTVGGRVAGGRVGLLGSASTSTEPRGTESMEAAYDGLATDAVEYRRYSITRGRTGGSGTVDYRANSDQFFSLTGLFTRYSDDEHRQRVTYDLGSDRLQRDLKDRLQLQSVASATATFNQMLAGGLPFDVHAAFTYAEEREPDKIDTAFRQRSVSFGEPVVDSDVIRVAALNEDYSRYALSSVAFSDLFVRGRELALGANLVAAQWANGGALRLGTKVRVQSKKRQGSETIHTGSGISFLAYMDPTADQPHLQGLLNFGPGVALDAAERISVLDGLTGGPNLEEAAEDYDGREVVSAAYVMADWPLAATWTLTAGLRVEHYAREYSAQTLSLDDGVVIPRASDAGQFTALPSVHLRFRPDSRTVFRTALTRSVSRPDYAQFAPVRILNRSELEVVSGNTALRTPTSWNVDVAVERYLEPLGVVSVGVFHKWLHDRVWWVSGSETIAGETFAAFHPANGSPALLRGIELAFENQLSFLPAPLDGLGVYATYRLASSSVTAQETVGVGPVPGQPRHAGNVELSYEKRRFSGRLGVNMHGGFLDNVDADDAANRVYGSRMQMDAAATVAITGGWRVFVEGINLTNAPVRYSQVETMRPVQVEYYEKVLRFGVRASF
jgi:TonB-dependent receptor